MWILYNEIRYAFRMVLKNPGFTTAVVLILALGIGASTAMFSIVNTFILNPVPLVGGNRLVEINEIDQVHNSRSRVSAPLYHDMQSHKEIFAKMASFTYDGIDAAGDEFVERLFGCRVTPSFFEIFSTRPTLGRVFEEQDGSPGNDDVVIISHSLWQRRFGGDAEIVGRKIETRDRTLTIVGVMPSHFQFPSRKALFWRPFQFTSNELTDPVQRQMSNWWAIAQLKAGVSRQEAQAFLKALNQRLAMDFPGTRQGWAVRVRPLRDFFVDPELQKTLWALMGAISFVLLIACANLANLQLARTESRLQEVSVRMALGAGRRHIVRQLLTESLLLSLLGGLGSVLVAVWGIKILSLLVPTWSPLLRPMVVDQSMLFCAFILSITTGIVLGLFPAWYACHIQLSESLKESGSTSSAGLGKRFLRNALVVGEVALAFVLLVGASLMIQSVIRMLHVDPGYNPANLARVDLTTRYGTRVDFEWRRTAFPAFAERLAALPGTAAVGLMGMRSGLGRWQVVGKEEFVESIVTQVGVGRLDLLRAIQLPLREGRLFEQMDNTEGQTGVVVNESFARLCWPGDSAVGKTIRGQWGGDASIRTRTIVGVVGDHREWGYEDEPDRTVYEPFDRDPVGGVHVLIRTSMDPASLLQAVRQEAKEVLLGSTYAPSIDWLEQVLWQSTYSRRLYMRLLCAFGGAGLVLSSLGIVGVLAFSVNRRQREIGIRMALGARTSDVLKDVLKQGLILTLVGVVIGLSGAFAMTRAISGLLYGVTPTDPMTFVAVCLLLVMVGLTACYLPARRAAKIDPMEALRYE